MITKGKEWKVGNMGEGDQKLKMSNSKIVKWPHSQQKSPNAVLGCSLKNDRMISVRFQGKPFNITVIQVYALTSNIEEAEVGDSMKTYKTF